MRGGSLRRYSFYINTQKRQGLSIVVFLSVQDFLKEGLDESIRDAKVLGHVTFKRRARRRLKRKATQDGPKQLRPLDNFTIPLDETHSEPSRISYPSPQYPTYLLDVDL